MKNLLLILASATVLLAACDTAPKSKMTTQDLLGDWQPGYEGELKYTSYKGGNDTTVVLTKETALSFWNEKSSQGTFTADGKYTGETVYFMNGKDTTMQDAGTWTMAGDTITMIVTSPYPYTTTCLVDKFENGRMEWHLLKPVDMDQDGQADDTMRGVHLKISK